MRTDLNKLFIIISWLSLVCYSAYCSPAIDKFDDLYWMWYPEQSSASVAVPPGKYFFRCRFNLPDSRDLLRAYMLVTADNSCVIYLNESECGFANDWTKINRIPLKKYIKRNSNILAIEAVNAGPGPSPAGIVGKIVLVFKDSKPPQIIPIDQKWKISKTAHDNWLKYDFDDSDWKNAEKVIPFGLGPWENVGAENWRVPDDFPCFIVPGYDSQMEGLRELFYKFYGTGTGGTLWDGWIVKSAIWPGGKSYDLLKRAFSKMLATRIMSDQGYISSHQHKGLAHNLGWPFPLWTQSGGIGWQFSVFGLPYGKEFGIHKATSVKEWTFKEIENKGIDNKGLHLSINSGKAFFTTPKFAIDSYVSPFIALEWKNKSLNLDSECYMQWCTQMDDEFSKDRRIYFSPITQDDGSHYTMLDVHKLPAWTGKITQLRFCFSSPSNADITIKKIYTAVDSRHNINNFCYLQGCIDYINWTGDLNFLRNNILKMRKALRYAIEEFNTQKYKCVNTPWVGHDGRSGIEIDRNGKKTVHFGRGIGNNYWDLLPCGGRDTTATIYLYDVLNSMAELQGQINSHPQWNIPPGQKDIHKDELVKHAKQIKDYAGKLFWNSDTGRYVLAQDINGQRYDYGYTTVNLEAIYYGFSDHRQSRMILDWIAGKRNVNGDTSTNEDIYHWSFAPRASTKRNLTYYSFIWPVAEKIPWGGQVQDGGAVLGFSYFDIISRLKIYGPDNAWQRLKQILDWYIKVKSEGGFREYYSKPGRGSLQGGGTAGGLGIDKEFAESILVPQVMVYGFMGIEPGLDALQLNPDLPAKWPSLTITQISYNDIVFDITAKRKNIVFDIKKTNSDELHLNLPAGKWRMETSCNNKTIKCETIFVKEKTDKLSTDIAQGLKLKFTKLPDK